MFYIFFQHEVISRWWRNDERLCAMEFCTGTSWILLLAGFETRTSWTQVSSINCLARQTFILSCLTHFMLSGLLYHNFGHVHFLYKGCLGWVLLLSCFVEVSALSKQCRTGVYTTLKWVNMLVYIEGGGAWYYIPLNCPKSHNMNETSNSYFPRKAK